jgi:hypothetical protein
VLLRTYTFCRKIMSLMIFIESLVIIFIRFLCIKLLDYVLWLKYSVFTLIYKYSSFLIRYAFWSKPTLVIEGNKHCRKYDITQSELDTNYVAVLCSSTGCAFISLQLWECTIFWVIGYSSQLASKEISSSLHLYSSTNKSLCKEYSC